MGMSSLFEAGKIRSALGIPESGLRWSPPGDAGEAERVPRIEGHSRRRPTGGLRKISAGSELRKCAPAGFAPRPASRPEVRLARARQLRREVDVDGVAQVELRSTRFRIAVPELEVQ